MIKNNKNSNFNKFLLLWAGELVSSIGGGLTSFGLGIYIFRETGSAGNMALITLLAFLPTLLLSVPAGVLADRYDRRFLMMLGDGLSGLGILYILILMFGGDIKLYQIGIGVFISSIFSSLLEPAYRATVTDLLTKEEYSKANGMVNLAGSARYLLSPIIAGALLAVSDIKLLLIIDIATFFLTVITTAVVKKGIETKKERQDISFMSSMKEGWRTIKNSKGVFILIMVSSIITCFMGVLQILAEPMILAFTTSTVLGICETICASGMLATSVVLGIWGIKKNYVRKLSFSLLLAGIAMVGFGFRENMLFICIFGFVFFAMLPFANNCLDYLVRTNISEELQGRVWGLIGFLSQIGYVIAYGFAGILADNIGNQFKIGVGRGAAFVVIAAGILLAITSLSFMRFSSVKRLEN